MRMHVLTHYCLFAEPSGVRNFSAITMNATTVLIQWKQPLILNGILSHFQVTINEQEYSTNNVTYIVGDLSKY